jgi:hypothetical protein
MILDMIADLGVWTWFIIGFLLLGLEILAPGTFFLWFAIAAILVGLADLVIDLPWQIELLSFAVLSVVFVVLGRRYFAGNKQESDRPGLNERAYSLIGRTYTLEEPISEGAGRLRIHDTVWRIDGPDTPAGTKVKIIEADGSTLKVEPEPSE